MSIEARDHEQGESLLPKVQGPTLGEKSILKFYIHCVIYIVFLIMTLALGYFIGSARTASPHQFGLLMPQGQINLTWEHNLTFTQAPSTQSEAAWASIIPVGRGFVHHAKLAPFISNIAVFHELHCLHAIIVAYYDALQSEPLTNLTDIPELDNNTATRIAPFHIRHCFDYIRQALMCASDTNLEVLEQETHLTNGWGQPKQCRDYQQVFDWAERFANSSDTGIVT